MMRALGCISAIVLLSVATFPQSNEVRAAFDMADVHVSPHRTIPAMSGGVLRGGRYALQNATMVDLIKTAYGVDDDSVIGGPSWLESDRFDVIAKAPTSTTPETVAIMLQTLLANRFNLTVKKDSKSLPAYVLMVGKGSLKLKTPVDPALTGCQSQPATTLYLRVSCHNMTMPALARQVRQMAGGYVADHPVVDMTNLKGAWDFDVKWTGRGDLPAAGADGISIFDAVEKQLGLKLELQNIPLPVIVVDKVNRKPTENLPGIGESLPTAPTEFEVADIKPSPPATTAPGNGNPFQPGGRIDLKGYTLRGLIQLAWDIRPNLSSDILVGGPKWMDSDHFDILAKAPVPGPSSGGATVDRDTLLMMLRALMADRFKLATHSEDRPATVYALVAPKGETKLKKADELERASCKPAGNTLPVSGDPSPMLAYRCQNTTLGQLAQNLPIWAGAYLDHPVVDTTRLTNGWDFLVSWTPRGGLPSAHPAGSAGDVVTAADPGGVSIFEAVEKQLGLKLEVQKHAIPVFVIDHVEKPTPN